MSKERNTDFTLNSLDDLFTSQNERDNGYLPNIQDIPLELLDDFPNHPFRVRDDEDMLKLIESVSERGVLVPAIVRPKADGRYELISGHRRKRASEAIIRIMKSFKNSTETLSVGSYRGFTMEIYISRGFRLDYILAIRGAMTHTINLGTDALGNITRIDNCIDHLAGNLEKAEKNLAETEKQLEIAKESLKEPFEQAEELAEKQERLDELNEILCLDSKDDGFIDEEPYESENVYPKKIKELSR